jgi:hypothetical protein
MNYEPKQISSRSKFKKINTLDWVAAICGGSALAYYAYNEFYTFVILALVTATLTPLLLAQKSTWFTNIQRTFGIQIKSWHLVGGVMCLGTFFMADMPAHAFFFKTIEDTIVSTLTSSGAGGSTSFVVTLFTVIRIAVLLALVFGIVYAINQSTQGNDLRPIAQSFGIGIMAIVAIEALSKWILGGDSTGVITIPITP